MIKHLTAIIALLAGGYFILSAVDNFDKVPQLNWNLTSVTIALLTIVLMLFGIGIVGSIWHMLLRDSGILNSWKQSQVVYAISQLGKYLPGNVGHHIGRVVMAKKIGIPVSITLNAMLVEMLWGTGIGGGLALLSLVFFVDNQMPALHLQFTPMQLGLGVVLLLSMPWLGVGFLNRYSPRLVKRLAGRDVIAAPKLSTALVVALMFILCFVVMGLILKLQAKWLFGVNEGSVFELMCLFSIAWLAGYLVPGAPAGLGVREAMMLLLMTPLLGAGTAVGLSMTLRVTSTLGDLLAFALGVLVRKFSP